MSIFAQSFRYREATVSMFNYLYFVILLSTYTYLRICITNLTLVCCIQLFLDLLLVKSNFMLFAETPKHP